MILLFKTTENDIDSTKREPHTRNMSLFKPTKIKIGIACLLLLLLLVLLFLINPGLTPVGAIVLLVFFPILLPIHIFDALQGDFSWQTNFTPVFFLLLLTYVILLYMILSVLYLLIRKLKNQRNLHRQL